MKKFRKITLILMIFCLFLNKNVLAETSLESKIETVEYTDEYKEWLELSDEEQSKVLVGNKFKIDDQTENLLPMTTNPLVTQFVGNSNLSRFSLKDVLGDAITVKNQKSLNLCWAFASLAAVESTLSYNDYKVSNAINTYDFSERHMDYASTRNAFLYNQINQKGYTRDMSAGGTYYMLESYLTNGNGAVAESEMPFENNQNNIDISEIQNKDVLTTIYDIDELSLRITDKDKLKEEMKNFITTYGGLYAHIHGASLMGEYYNNTTGAIYCDQSDISLIDHAVVIIGWDDNYSKSNFNSSHQPSSDGAWIVKNSWGDKIEVTLDEIKKANYEANQTTYTEMGYNSYTDLPNQDFINYLINQGYTPNSDNTVFTYIIGDNGYMYISYEDELVYSMVVGFKKASYGKDYDNIYQNDLLGCSQIITLNYTGPLYLANSFSRTTSSTEDLDKISIYAPVSLKSCKVYVNPTSTDKSKSNLQEIQLKEGSASTNTIDIERGYHMIEFAEPIQLTGSGFTVVLEYQSEEQSYIALESVASNGWENAIVNSGESFLSTSSDFENNVWTDLALLNDESLRGNASLKAYTETSDTENFVTLSSISITNSPTKIAYTAGEDFDSTGMIVVASYSDGSKKTVTNYSIKNGTSLTEGQTSVKISYTENNITKETEQAITVSSSNSANVKTPKSSDFSNAKVAVTNLNSKTAKITMTVSNIAIGDTADDYKYSYSIMIMQLIGSVIRVYNVFDQE